MELSSSTPTYMQPRSLLGRKNKPKQDFYCTDTRLMPAQGFNAYAAGSSATALLALASAFSASSTRYGLLAKLE
jgi:hypothetical protein